MPSHRLPNYVRAHRKRRGFSQEEIAFLLGCQCGAHVCQYERYRRNPSRDTAWGYEIIFGGTSRELFAGDYRKIEDLVARRAKRLIDRLLKEEQTKLTARKIEALTAVFHRLKSDAPEKP